MKKTFTEADLLEKIAAMPDGYREIGERLHALVRSAAPDLTPTLWYGMPAYAREGRTVVFFRGAKGERYVTLGFDESARLDAGGMWPTSYAVKEWSSEVEAQVEALVKRA